MPLAYRSFVDGFRCLHLELVDAAGGSKPFGLSALGDGPQLQSGWPIVWNPFNEDSKVIHLESFKEK